jgi:SAM-dependent methyltransferase
MASSQARRSSSAASQLEGWLLALLLLPIRLLLAPLRLAARLVSSTLSRSDKAESYTHFSHLALNVLPPQTQWLNMGWWLPTAEGREPTFPEACAALARHLYERALPSPAPKGLRILDVGHGAGESLRLIAAELKPATLHGVTSLPAHARVARERCPSATVFCTDATGFLRSSDADTYDVIFALDCAYHFPSRAEFLEAAAARLAPGGVLALIDLCAASPLPDASTLQLNFKYTPSSLPRPPPSTLRSYLKLRRTCLLAGVPFVNMVSAASYASDLAAAGLTQAHIEDISHAMWPGFSRFLRGIGRGQESAWRGGSHASWWGLRAFGSVVETWAEGKGVRCICVTATRPPA